MPRTPGCPLSPLTPSLPRIPCLPSGPTGPGGPASPRTPSEPGGPYSKLMTILRKQSTKYSYRWSGGSRGTITSLETRFTLFSTGSPRSRFTRKSSVSLQDNHLKFKTVKTAHLYLCTTVSLISLCPLSTLISFSSLYTRFTLTTRLSSSTRQTTCSSVSLWTRWTSRSL